ncbi:sensor histidine kinase [Sediminibacillus halophilus]|uniref:Two-component system, sensor histidine kinase YesM n=1 Tax=Sediminibacillus halophilus TaxID=482461 RepID=A0A1G9U8R5_9BACI|nr:sensor histidine kinase [Sediminibacillus halophilus]SDM55925.1 two-component system, sensor histidine kinase YesM [Sediminibacillus halophilus]
MEKRIKRLAQFFRRRMFHRILLIYSAIILGCMFILFFITDKYYTDVVVKKEIDKSYQRVEKITSFIDDKNEKVSKAVRELYYDRDLIEDVTHALQYDYNNYLSYRLDMYSMSGSSVPSHFGTFLNSFYSQDDGITAVSLSDPAEREKYYQIYKNEAWNLSKEEREGKLSANTMQSSDLLKVSTNINNPVTLDLVGYLNAYYSFDEVNRMLKLQKDHVKASIYIYNNDEQLLFRFGDKLAINPIDKLAFGDQTANLETNGSTYYTNSLTDSSGSYMVVAVLAESKIKEVTTRRKTMLGITLFISLLAILVTYWSIRRYSQRFLSIEQTMKQVQAGDLDVRIPIKKETDDLSIIAGNFNIMLDDVNNYIKKIYLSSIKQKEAELKNLQTQINPHFLYNTLESIRMKAISDGSRTTADMIVLLADMFRYSLEQDDVVTLEEEIAHVSKYVELFKVRQPNKLQFDVQLPAHLKDKSLPRFILQPLVENYIIHGIRRNKYDNTLVIAVYEEAACLMISIVDNGKGIKEEKKKVLQTNLRNGLPNNESLGLFNVNERIRLKYGNTYGLEISSEEEKGTKILVKLPINEMEAREDV